MSDGAAPPPPALPPFIASRGRVVGGASRCLALTVETAPRHAISIWDIERADCSRRAAVFEEDAICGNWARNVVVDFDVNQAVISASDRTLQLWDLRKLGVPLGKSERPVCGDRLALLHVHALGTSQARCVCSDKGGTLCVMDLSNVEGGRLKELQLLYGHREEVRWGHFDWGYGTDSCIRGATLSGDGELLTWNLPSLPIDWDALDQEIVVKSDEAAGAADTADGAVDDAAFSQQDSCLLTGVAAAEPEDSGAGRAAAPEAAEGEDAADAKVDRREAMLQRLKPIPLPNRYLRMTRVAIHQVLRLHQAAEARSIVVTGDKDGAVQKYLADSMDDDGYREESDGTGGGHLDQVSAMTLDADGRRMVTGSLDRTVRVWSLSGVAGLECAYVLKGHEGSVRALAADFYAERAISCGADEKMMVWDLGSDFRLRGQYRREASLLGQLPMPPRVAMPVEVLANFFRARAAMTTREGQLRVWDLERQDLIASLDAHPRALIAVQLGTAACGGTFEQRSNEEPDPELAHEAVHTRVRSGFPRSSSRNLW